MLLVRYAYPSQYVMIGPLHNRLIDPLHNRLNNLTRDIRNSLLDVIGHAVCDDGIEDLAHLHTSVQWKSS